MPTSAMNSASRRWQRAPIMMVLLIALLLSIGASAQIRVKGTRQEGTKPFLEGSFRSLEELNAAASHTLSFTRPNNDSSLFTSTCSPVTGCPRNSMVWASGPLTYAELLTPASFAVEANLTLQLSLCCKYYYRTSMLVDGDLYDRFLSVLLQATPFQVLSSAEKRGMFPQAKAFIRSSSTGKVFTASSVLADAPRDGHGQGDVLVLVSGAFERPQLAQEQVEAAMLLYDEEEVSQPRSESTPSIPKKRFSRDVQLKVVNEVLKCKCPHTLLVMPILRLHSDALPPVSIVGLGSHCANTSASTNASLTRSPPMIARVEMPSQPGTMGYALSFYVTPAVPPATVVTWRVRQEGRSSLVLDHQFVVGAVVDPSDRRRLLPNHAHSPFFLVSPHQPYTVEVQLSRGYSGSPQHQRTEGRFVLRVPFDRHWELPPVAMAPHFGFERNLRLSAATMAHAEDLRAALRPTSSGSGHYRSFWSNTPRDDQLLPQHPIRIPHNPFSTTESHPAFPLFVGRNDVALWVADVDEVCEAVRIEDREWWAVQAIVLSRSPATACEESVPVEALQLHGLLHQMRTERPFLVNVPHTSWEASPEELGIEGSFNCSGRVGRPSALRGEAAPAGKCRVAPALAAYAAGTHASLRMDRRGVYDVHWVTRVAVRPSVAATILADENLDKQVATRVVGSTAGGDVLIDVRSRLHIVVRRVSHLPRHVHVELPMHALRWKVQPPTTADRSVSADHPGPSGRWSARWPLVEHSVDERGQLEVNVEEVPNVRRVLPNRTLQFIAEDPGEDLEAVYGLNYRSRCPDMTVEYLITVVPFPAPAITPAYVPIYTEEHCILLDPPRAPRKDELVSWKLPPNCGRFVERYQHVEGDEGIPRVVSTPREGREWVAPGQSTRNIGATLTLMACGMQAYHRCDVRWEAQNLVGTVSMTYSLRRCLRPPSLLYHADQLQQTRSYPSSIFQLPRLLLAHDPMALPVGDGANITTTTHTRHSIPVLPIAGEAATYGYSFNHTGLQEDFEAHIGLVAGAAANQLFITRRHHPYQGEGPSLVVAGPIQWRSRARRDVVYAADTDRWDDEAITPASWWQHITGFPSNSAPHDVDRDARINAEVHLRHAMDRRRVDVAPVFTSAAYPLNITIRTSTTAALAAQANRVEVAEDVAVFAARGMCAPRREAAMLLTLQPLGTVRVDERFGVSLPGPTAPAVAVLPVCRNRYVYSRHPDLHSIYGYDLTWSCTQAREQPFFEVDKFSPTHSLLSAVEPKGWSGRGGAKQAWDGWSNLCSLTVRNAITGTQQVTAVELRRVWPTPLPNLNFVVLSENALGAGNRSISQVGAKALRPRRVVGKSVVLHIDSATPAIAAAAPMWVVESAVPAKAAGMGHKVLMDAVQFTALPNHPAALARGRGGTTVLVSGFARPGLYTIALHTADPIFPEACPNASLVETFEVFHAEVVEKELVICGDAATLRAIPLPRELTREFVGQWEVVSLQTSDTEVWTAGTNFTGITFDSGNRASTLVHGLPFGILTMRWAIYRHSDDGGRLVERILVDYDVVRVLVLTENLASHRVVTLSESLELTTTSSTRDWFVEEDPTHSTKLQLTTLRHSGLTSYNYSRAYSTDPAFSHVHLGPQTQLRPGAGLLTLRNLPEGPIYLGYQLIPSSNLFGEMQGRTCSLAMRLEVERVSAYFTTNINMDHECDAYTGKGRIQLCLHAELSPQHKNRRARYVEATGNDGQPWSSHVQLVDANRLEGIIKGGAASLEKQHCGVPWWLWSTSSWRNVTLVEKAGLPSGRCMSFFVTAGRHLSPREAAQPFFASTGSGESCGGDVVSSSVIEGAVVTSSSGGSNAFSTHGVPKRFLPVMQTGRLERLHHALRPLLGLQGLPEEATTELNVSRGNESIVTFRLDVAERLAGFPMYGSDASHSADLGNATSALLHGSPSWSILRQCANGTVRAADVLPYWMEINRPDGALDVTSPEWLEYVEQVRHTLVPCEVLFRSLQTLVNPAAGDRKRHEHQPDADERLVSLTALEHQLDSIQQTSKYTKDGIEVTGLRPDLQEALSRRTITRSQLAAIEEARRHRREAEEQAHRRRQLELANAESLRTPAERLRIALQRYAQATHEEVATIRIRLPSYDPFAVPYDTYLRTALHKDAVCGTELGPREETTRTNPYALIPLGKVKIVDAPPTLSIEPKIIKQCEVEGEIPLITVSLSGSVWAKEAFHNAQVRLEEVQNPNISRNEPDTVGLRPCLGQLHEGLSTTVSGSTRKHLYLQLGACPGFQLLSPMEYNEQEDSAMLLEKLRYPRLLRVTVLQALKPDSFTSRSSHMPSGTDLSFIVEVRPTLARLHLRTGAMHRDEVGQASDANTRWLLPGATTEAAHPLRRYFRDRQPPVPFLPTESRPLVLCERDLRQHGFDLGVELIGDQWMDPVGEAQLHTHEDQARLLQRYADLVAEHAQFEDEEDAEYLLASGANNEDPNAPSHRHRRRRTPENIALLNSFSVVAHYSYDSTHHLYLKGGGVYRSHFVHYLFSSILADPQVLNEHAFVFRYNTSFMAVTVPPQPASHTDDGGDDPFLTMAANGEQEWGWPIAQEEPSATDATARGRRSTPATTSGVDVRRFSKIEEILFAIPGIATHCRGCLLADTTLYVAGDLTGVWSWKQPSMWSSSSTSHTLDHSSLRGPLLIPWHAADTIPRQWAFSWVCPHAAQRALEQLEKYQTYYASYRRRRSGEASEPLPPVYLEMNVVMYAMRDALGTPLPPSARPTVVLRSEPMWLTNDQGAMAPGGSSFTALHAESSSTFVDGLVFQINASSASAGFTTLAADVLAHRRLGSPLISSTFDYRFGGAVAEGRLTANASVFVQVCVPVEVVEGPSRKLGNSRCTVVSITDALMVLEPPVRAPTLSFLHRWLRGSSDAMVAHDEVAATPTTSPIIHFIMDALHHAFLSTLLYWLLATGHLRLGGQLPTPSTDSWMAEEERRHLSFSIMCFMALCFIYHYIPVVWVLAWLALWMQVLYASTRPQVLLYFVLSMLYWWYVM